MDKTSLKAWAISLLKVMGYQAVSAALTALATMTVISEATPKDMVILYMMFNLFAKAGLEAWQQMKISAERAALK